MRTTEDKDVKAYTVYNCVNEDKFKKRITPEERKESGENLDLRGGYYPAFLWKNYRGKRCERVTSGSY